MVLPPMPAYGTGQRDASLKQFEQAFALGPKTALGKASGEFLTRIKAAASRRPASDSCASVSPAAGEGRAACATPARVRRALSK